MEEVREKKGDRRARVERKPHEDVDMDRTLRRLVQ